MVGTSKVNSPDKLYLGFSSRVLSLKIILAKSPHLGAITARNATYNIQYSLNFYFYSKKNVVLCSYYSGNV